MTSRGRAVEPAEAANAVGDRRLDLHAPRRYVLPVDALT
jgi:hypothetical protein